MYYYLKGNDKIGPVSKDEVINLYRAKDIDDETLIWTEGWHNWRRFGDLRAKKQSAPSQINNQKNNLSEKDNSNNYIISSWRGEKSLAVSYWVNGFLFTFILQLAIGIYSSATSLFPDIARGNVQLYYAIALLFEVFVIVLSVWQTVCIWRSADKHKKKTNRIFFARLAQLAIIITAIGSFVKIGNLGNYYNDVFWNALGKDPLGNYTVQETNDGSTLKISGMIAYGLASEVDKALAANPKITTVVLNSVGGRIWEGENLYDVLRKRNIYETRTETGCSSACTIPYLAGNVRTVKDDKNLLGFHSSRNPYYFSSANSAENRRWQTFLVSKGVSNDFTKKALGTPPNDMWLPDIKILIKEGIVTKNSLEPTIESILSINGSNSATTKYADNRGLGGLVVDGANADGYTYILIEDGGKRLWAAAPEFKVAVGDSVTLPGNAMPMQNYESKSLKRTFDVVYFVDNVMVNEVGMAPAAPKNAPVQGHPQVVIQPVQKYSGVAKADMTVAEVFAQRRSLAGKQIKIRGKVIKFSPEVMGKNWIHLQDGTGSNGSNDLTVTTLGMSKQGDTVLIRGTVIVDKDFGYGYFYPVFIEDADILVE